MDAKKSKADVLEDLSVALADELLARINSGEATPADLNVARAMLKDNNIIVNVESDHPATKLAVVLPFAPRKAINE